MSGQFGITLIKILIFFPMVIGLILWLGKVTEKFNGSGRTATMKIVERLQVSKDNSLLIVRIGEKFYLVTSAQGKIDIVREIELAEVNTYKNTIMDEKKPFMTIGEFLKNKNFRGSK
ncbi:MAG: flagellar biosynthetic protein FliO [Clostridium sp.]|uniref:flagellar biosynthetic protein FliO n=1 Tax=Clostridium sp. TaxID=1506 RepID=UPI00302A966B